eukprot:gene6489-7193_t
MGDGVGTAAPAGGDVPVGGCRGAGARRRALLPQAQPNIGLLLALRELGDEIGRDAR